MIKQFRTYGNDDRTAEYLNQFGESIVFTDRDINEEIWSAVVSGWSKTLHELLKLGMTRDQYRESTNTETMTDDEYNDRIDTKLLIPKSNIVDIDMLHSMYDIDITCLMDAVQRNHIDCVKVLLDYGADISITNMDGETALDFAINKNHREIIDLLTI
jgi:ankyrin repeat protein